MRVRVFLYRTEGTGLYLGTDVERMWLGVKGGVNGTSDFIYVHR